MQVVAKSTEIADLRRRKTYYKIIFTSCLMSASSLPLLNHFRLRQHEEFFKVLGGLFSIQVYFLLVGWGVTFYHVLFDYVLWVYGSL